MAWGVGTTKADAQAYEVGLETDVAEADVDSTGFYLDDAVGPTTEFDAQAWYGEDETYGTQSDWLTGEGLTTAWGNDPKDRIRSTYDNSVMEYMGEHPLLPLVGLDARGMLRRGGSPGPWDYVALGLSMIPVAGPAALKMARPHVQNAITSLKGWGKKAIGRPYRPLGSDYTFQELNTPVNELGLSLRSVKPGDAPLPSTILQPKPGMTIRGTKYDDPYMYLAFPETAPIIYRGTKLGDEAVRLQPNAVLREVPSAKDVMKMPADEFYAMDTKIQDRLLKNADLTRKDISTIHWVNEGKEIHVAMASLADELGNSALAAEINAAIKARDKLISNLSNPERQRLGLGSTAISDAMTQAFEDIAIAQLKPAHLNVSDKMWAIVTKGKTLSEVKDIARKLTLRIVD